MERLTKLYGAGRVRFASLASTPQESGVANEADFRHATQDD